MKRFLLCVFLFVLPVPALAQGRCALDRPLGELVAILGGLPATPGEIDTARADDIGRHLDRTFVEPLPRTEVLMQAEETGEALRLLGQQALLISQSARVDDPRLLRQTLRGFLAGFDAWCLVQEAAALGNGSERLSQNVSMVPRALIQSPINGLSVPALTAGGLVAGLLAFAATLFFRNAIRGVPKAEQNQRVVPKIVLAVVTLAVLPQLIALASPILPETTVFDAGVDSVVKAG